MVVNMTENTPKLHSMVGKVGKRRKKVDNNRENTPKLKTMLGKGRKRSLIGQKLRGLQLMVGKGPKR